MKANRHWIIALLLCLFILGCGGGVDPVNKGKDRPAPKKDK
jgi:hypothetical protein